MTILKIFTINIIYSISVIISIQVLNGQSISETTSEQILSGVYHYSYPDNTPDLNEDHFLVFFNDGKILKGLYYATSDEFDEDRAGYLPGFFVANLNNLIIKNDSIFFSIHLESNEIFTKALPLTIRTSKQAKDQNYKKWEIAEQLPKLDKKYIGIIKSESIFFKGFIPVFDKIFKKVSK